MKSTNFPNPMRSKMSVLSELEAIANASKEQRRKGKTVVVEPIDQHVQSLLTEVKLRFGRIGPEERQWLQHTVFKPRTEYADTFTRRYDCDEYSCMGHPRGCLFCKHCIDVYWDCTSGPYMFFCRLATTDGEGSYATDNTHRGVFGKCDDFEEASD